MSTTGFRIAVGDGLVRLSGELDVSTAPILSDALATLEGEPTLTVNVAGLDFIDSAGVGILAQAAANLAKQGSTMVIVGARDAVRRVFDMVHASTWPNVTLL